MDSAGPQPLGYTAGAERHLLERGVVGEHRDHHSARQGGVARPLHARRAGFDQRLGLRRRAIINAQLVPGGEEVGGHRLTHRAQSDKSDFRVHRGNKSFL
jgi:hypothetical protein